MGTVVKQPKTAPSTHGTHYAVIRGCIATVNADGSVPLNSRVVAGLEGDRTDAALAELLRRANAMPELLAAAVDCLPDLEHYVSTHGPGPDLRLDALRAAIAKATRQPATRRHERMRDDGPHN